MRTYIFCKLCQQKILESKFISHLNSCKEIQAKKKEKVFKYPKQIKKEILNKRIRLNRPKIDLELEAITFYIIWDDIFFEENRIKFSPNRINAILHSVEFRGTIPELNEIKQEYFKRLFDKEVYKLKFYKSNLLISASPDWDRIKNKIEIGKQYFEFKTTKTTKIGPSLSIDHALKLFGSSFKKSHYLKFLASIQEKEFKLIPIMEFIGNLRENSFIFRIRSRNNNIIFIWENANENRATHFFVSDMHSSETRLISLQSFICTQMPSKRSLLYQSDNVTSRMKEELGYFSTIRHENIDSYKMSVKAILKKT